MSLGHIRRHVLYPGLRPPAQALAKRHRRLGVASTGHEITFAHGSEEWCMGEPGLGLYSWQGY